MVMSALEAGRQAVWWRGWARAIFEEMFGDALSEEVIFKLRQEGRDGGRLGEETMETVGAKAMR